MSVQDLENTYQALNKLDASVLYAQHPDLAALENPPGESWFDKIGDNPKQISQSEFLLYGKSLLDNPNLSDEAYYQAACEKLTEILSKKGLPFVSYYTTHCLDEFVDGYYWWHGGGETFFQDLLPVSVKLMLESYTPVVVDFGDKTVSISSENDTLLFSKNVSPEWTTKAFPAWRCYQAHESWMNDCSLVHYTWGYPGAFHQMPSEKWSSGAWLEMNPTNPALLWSYQPPHAFPNCTSLENFDPQYGEPLNWIWSDECSSLDHVFIESLKTLMQDPQLSEKEAEKLFYALEIFGFIKDNQYQGTYAIP